MVAGSLDSLAPPGYVSETITVVPVEPVAIEVTKQTTTITYSGCEGACAVPKPACLSGCKKPCCAKPACPKPKCVPNCKKPCCVKPAPACAKPKCVPDCKKSCCAKPAPACEKPKCMPDCKKSCCVKPACAKPACPKDCAKPCCKSTESNWTLYVVAYLVWFIIAIVIFYLIFASSKPAFLMDGKELNVGKTIGVSFLCALVSLIILQLILWVVGW